MTGKRGAQPVYSDLAIETALTFRLLFRLPLRQTEGFLHAILTVMGLALPCPDHTTLSRRHATVAIRQQVDRALQGPISLIVDSTGLKVCGQGEWHSQKHGEKKRKRWKKLHIGVDAPGQIVASTVTESHAQDPSQVPALLSQVDYRIDRFIAVVLIRQGPHGKQGDARWRITLRRILQAVRGICKTRNHSELITMALGTSLHRPPPSQT
jgi:hypothetical protein